MAFEDSRAPTIGGHQPFPHDGSAWNMARVSSRMTGSDVTCWRVEVSNEMMLDWNESISGGGRTVRTVRTFREGFGGKAVLMNALNVKRRMERRVLIWDTVRRRLRLAESGTGKWWRR